MNTDEIFKLFNILSYDKFYLIYLNNYTLSNLF
jgi:hypothetical protein